MPKKKDTSSSPSSGSYHVSYKKNINNKEDYLINMPAEKDTVNIPLTSLIRKQYEERLLSISEGLTKLVKDLKNDRIIQQMDKDQASAVHIKERIFEIIKDALRAEQEGVVQRLIEDVSKLENANLLLNEKCNEIENILESEKNVRNEKEKKINQLKIKVKELLATQSSMEGFKLNDLHTRIGSLEQELVLKENDIKKKKKMVLKERVENKQLIEDLNVKNLELVELRQKVKELEDQLQEKENLIQQKEKYVEKLQEKSEQFHEANVKMVEEVSQKVADEAKLCKNTNKILKKKVFELEEALKQKSEQANEANSIILRVQTKINKYKERYEESERKRERIEKEFKRIKTDLEESIERERKAHNDLQTEFGKRMNDRVAESEKRIKEIYEGKIFTLEREIHQKEALIQKSQYEQLWHTQMFNNLKTMQPEQVDKMLEVYESKLKTFQRDYMQISEHERIVSEMESKFNSEKKDFDRKLENDKKDLERKLENEFESKMKDLEHRKQKEFNYTISNIKQAVKDLENTLDEERDENKKLRKDLMQKEEEIGYYRGELKEIEKKKQGISSQFEESQKNLEKLKEIIDKETTEKQQIQQHCASLSEEVKTLSGQLDEFKKYAESLDAVVKQKKLEVSKLKESITGESERFDELARENQELNANNEKLKKENKKLSETINSAVDIISLANNNSIEFRKYRVVTGKIEDIEDLCLELNRCIEGNKIQYQQTIQELNSKYQKEIKKLEEIIRKKKHNDSLTEFKFKTEISSLRREIDGVKQLSTSQLTMMRQQMKTYLESILQKSNDIIINKDNEMYKRKQNYEKEISELRIRYDKDLNDIKIKYEKQLSEAKNSYQIIETDLRQQLATAEQQLKQISKDKSSEMSEKNLYLKKFDDLKRLVKVISDHLPIPTDVSNGLLCPHTDSIEKAFHNFNSLLITFGKEKEQYKFQQERMADDIKNLKAQVNILEGTNQKLEVSNNLLKKTNEDTLKEFQDLVIQLNKIKKEVDTLEQSRERELNETQLKLKGSFEKQITELSKKFETDKQRALQLEKDKFDTEVNLLKKQLEEALKEIDVRKAQILEQQKLRDKEKQETIELRRSVTENEKKIKEVEREREHYKKKSDKNEKRYKAYHDMLNSLSNVAATASSNDDSLEGSSSSSIL
ncbi:hypothetical protein ABK040_009709 [Willaertia magna]